MSCKIPLCSTLVSPVSLYGVKLDVWYVLCRYNLDLYGEGGRRAELGYPASISVFAGIR